MPHRLDGKVALITGGTSGIGEATVELFVGEGARVVFTGRNAAKGAEIAARLGADAHFFRADVTRPEEVEASVVETVAIFGRIDALFSNAGGRTEGGADTITPDGYREAMDLLVGSALFGIRYAAPHMKRQGGGAIISNASIAAQRAHMGGYLYSAAKAAVVQASRMAAVELGPWAIRVNTISPGAIATPIFMGGSDVAAGLEAERVQAKMAKLEGNLAKANALLTSGYPADIAWGALYLASDEGRFVTGHDLVIDGGMTAGGRTNFEDGRVGSAT